MRSTTAIFVSLVTILSLATGCSPKRRALDHDAAVQISSVRFESAVPQNEVNIRVEQSQAGSSFGLIGALIDAGVTSSRQSEADEYLTSLRAALGGFDFREDFWRATETALHSAEWPQEVTFLTTAEKPQSTNGPGFRSGLSGMEEDAYVLMETEYFLTPGGIHVAVKTSVNLYKRTAMALYSSQFTYYSMPMGFGSDASSIVLWAADEAEAFQHAIRQGIAYTVRMLHIDFLDGNAKNIEESALEQLPESTFAFGNLEGLKSFQVKGRVLSHEDGIFLVRASSGFLFAFSEDAPEEITGDSSEDTMEDAPEDIIAALRPAH